MTSNLLCLNPSKTELILIGLREQLKKIQDPSITLNLDSASTHFHSNSPIRKLGVIFDQNLSFSDHITHLNSRSCFMHIRYLRRIRPMFDIKTTSTIATYIVHAKFLLVCSCTSRFMGLRLGTCASIVRRRIHPLRG